MKPDPEPGTILGPTGNPVDQPKPQEEKTQLPLDLKNYIDNQLNAALDQLRENNRADLARIADERVAPWKLTTRILAILLLAGAFLTWLYFSPERLAGLVSKYVTEQVAEPTVRRTIVNAADNVAADIVNKSIEPLEARATSLATRMDAMATAIENRQKALTAEQDRLRSRVHVQQLDVAAKMGDAVAFKELQQIAANDHDNGTAATVYLGEIERYFLADRHSFMRMFFVDRATREHVNMPLEAAIDSLQSSDLNLRIAAADELAERGRPATAGALCRALKIETDLRVVTRITRALEMLTKQPISPLDVEGASDWWQKNGERPEFDLRYRPALDSIQIVGGTGDYGSRVVEESARMAIPLLKAVVDGEPQADVSRLWLILCHISVGEIEAAASQTEAMSKNGVQTYYLPIARAAVAAARSDHAKAVEEINRALALSSDTAAFVHRWALFSSLGNDTGVKWPAKEATPTQGH